MTERPDDRSARGERPATDFRLYGFGMAFVGGWARLQYGLEALGVENVPAKGGALVVANHGSFLDIAAIAKTCPRRVSFVARENLVDIPVLGFLIRHWGPILLRRGAIDVAAIRAVVESLRAGNLVVLFPEGTRTRDGELQRFQRGFALAVRRAGVPILPVGIAGSFEAFPRTRKIPRLRGRLVVSYGPPFALPAHERPEDLDTVASAILREMARARERWSERARLPYRAPSAPRLESNTEPAVPTPPRGGGPGSEQ